MKSARYILFILIMTGMTAGSQVSAGTDTDNDDETDSTEVAGKLKPRFDFFGAEDVLEMSISFDVKEFMKTKNEEDRNYNALLQVFTNGDTLAQNIKIKARGKMRRKYCSFPPILMKFKDKKDAQPLFSRENIKLVTHCSQAGNFENYLMKEYLAYKLYSMITPYSYKTRLVLVNYIDSRHPKSSYTEYGFLIENTDDMAERNHAAEIEQSLNQGQMDDYEMARMAFFNYMIGNTDWSVQSLHNVKILRTTDPANYKIIPVSYDFDYSGFVNTQYAIPNDKVPIKTVSERYFQGTCFSDEILKAVIHEFETKQPLIQQAIEDFRLMNKGQRKQALAYVNGFFRKYKREDVLISDINQTCFKFQ